MTLGGVGSAEGVDGVDGPVAIVLTEDEKEEEKRKEKGAPEGRGPQEVVGSLSVPGPRHSEHVQQLERDDSVEWMIFDNKNTTTASIRHRLFDRRVSIQPEK